MQLLRVSEVQVSNGDRVFSYSRWRAVLVALLMLASAVVCVLIGRRQPAATTRYLSYYVAAVFLVGFFFFRRFVTARFRPTNWMVRVGLEGLFIKFRSYLNYSLPDDDQIVAFLPYHDIRSVRVVRDHTTFADMQGHRATQTMRLVELDLAVDVTELAKALDTERARPASSEKHWYGTSSTLFRHYPVLVKPPSFLQMQWSVTPGWKAFLAALGPFAQIAPPLSVSEDLTRLSSLSREQQEQRLRWLDARGETVLAIYTARRLYGYDLSEAKSFVDTLRGTDSQQRRSPM